MEHWGTLGTLEGAGDIGWHWEHWVALGDRTLGDTGGCWGRWVALGDGALGGTGGTGEQWEVVGRLGALGGTEAGGTG